MTQLICDRVTMEPAVLCSVEVHSDPESFKNVPEIFNNDYQLPAIIYSVALEIRVNSQRAKPPYYFKCMFLHFSTPMSINFHEVGKGQPFSNAVLFSQILAEEKEGVTITRPAGILGL
ncbi:hypothetical protein L873DRAFT_1787490 [Choiromyces venosus 120613-1]|uniref:Uncharacterized protein n=1 Tax=Choiromyces venosus 120613-1 TaxID=1336337 RepID=A0A3N4K0H2_9PEZI|nr:hypothetical protein L873DRAFT_1787490 [Choiromyces venosus 120613-1]